MSQPRLAGHTNRHTALARAVDAEFFVTHFVYFPAMEALAGTGYFGGSNALWQASVLREYGFHRSMHCEDVDLSAPHPRRGDPAGSSSLSTC